MFGSALKAMTTGIAAMPVNLDEARGQDGLCRRQLFEPTVDLAANECGMARDAHGDPRGRYGLLISC